MSLLVFKKRFRICSRKITKLVTRKSAKGDEDLDIKSKEFVAKVKKYIQEEGIGLDQVFNTDQSGLTKRHTLKVLWMSLEKQKFTK